MSNQEEVQVVGGPEWISGCGGCDESVYCAVRTGYLNKAVFA
jgi:hypothetical protein